MQFKFYDRQEAPKSLNQAPGSLKPFKGNNTNKKWSTTFNPMENLKGLILKIFLRYWQSKTILKLNTVSKMVTWNSSLSE